MAKGRRGPRFERSPFGNPDGSRASIDEISQGFVSFGNFAFWGGLATEPEDLTARVLVGRKGSGKTVYLRRLQASCSENNSLFADQIQQDLPTTSLIVKFCQFFPSASLTESWMLVWRRAIILSLSSHMLCNVRLKSNISAEDKHRIANDFKDLVRPYKAQVSVYSQVSEIINSYHTRVQMERYLNNSGWAELETVIAQILSTAPPICFFLDAVDEEFAHAPMYWLRCQKGLFYQTMRLVRDAALGSRLHTFICIRDSVLSSILQSEHQTRYRNEPHIRVLGWNYRAAEYLLEQKIRALSNQYFLDKFGQEKNVEAWLGTSEILNHGRSVREPIKRYLLRHTRLLPRDITLLGNALCEAVALIKGQGQKQDVQDTIRNCVSRVAKSLGDEQIAICANEWASVEMPHDAGKHGYSDSYTANRDYAKGLADDFKTLIRSIGVDRFDQQGLTEARKRSVDFFKADADPFQVLWINGLVGYVDGPENDEKYVFFSEGSGNDFRLPDRTEYVFHPIVIDSARLRSVGSRPVIPFYE